MIKKRMVFVIGAGANTTYGFPTGLELTQETTQRSVQNYDDMRRLVELTGHDEQRFVSFGRSLFLSGFNSVDAFLQRRGDLVEIGRIMIAYALIQKENAKDNLFKYDGWLRYVYSKMDAPLNEYAANAVSFITFNYDRCIEHFFFTALKVSNNRKDEEIAHILRQIPIIHLHGSLGRLPWQDGPGDAHAYGAPLSSASLKIAAQGVKIIHEDITDGRDKDFDAAKSLISDADLVVFLGFGFNSLNVTRLGLTDISTSAVATAFGLEQSEIKSLGKLTNHKIGFGPRNQTCLNLLRTTIDWD